MKRLKWILLAFLILTGVGLLFAAVLAFEQAKGKAVIKGIRQLRKGQAESVSLSNLATRVLTRNDGKAELAFRQRMGENGWEFVCYYGRCALYRNLHQEVLVRKNPLLGGFCIYELMDESYFRHVKSDIREVA